MIFYPKIRFAQKRIISVLLLYFFFWSCFLPFEWIAHEHQSDSVEHSHSHSDILSDQVRKILQNYPQRVVAQYSNKHTHPTSKSKTFKKRSRTQRVPGYLFYSNDSDSNFHTHEIQHLNSDFLSSSPLLLKPVYNKENLVSPLFAKFAYPVILPWQSRAPPL